MRIHYTACSVIPSVQRRALKGYRKADLQSVSASHHVLQWISSPLGEPHTQYHGPVQRLLFRAHSAASAKWILVARTTAHFVVQVRNKGKTCVSLELSYTGLKEDDKRKVADGNVRTETGSE